MAAPLRILLADDQVPWDNDADNQRTKEEIRREFAIAKPDVNVDRAFAADYRWFTGLLDYLERTRYETVTCARTFDEAKKHLENPRDFDVAVIDLSWWGDHTLDPGASNRQG